MGLMTLQTILQTPQPIALYATPLAALGKDSVTSLGHRPPLQTPSLGQQRRL
jgi:hypothetical protein